MNLFSRLLPLSSILNGYTRETARAVRSFIRPLLNDRKEDKTRRKGGRNMEQTVARSREMVCEINRAGTREQRQIKSSCGVLGAVQKGRRGYFSLPPPSPSLPLPLLLLLLLLLAIFPLWSHVPPHIVHVCLPLLLSSFLRRISASLNLTLGHSVIVRLTMNRFDIYPTLCT